MTTAISDMFTAVRVLNGIKSAALITELFSGDLNG